MVRKLNRRQILRYAVGLTGAAAAGGLVGACGPAAPAPAPTAAPTTAPPAATPASAPKPAATTAPPAVAPTSAPKPAAATAAPAQAKPVTIVYWYWADTPAIGTFFRETVDKFNSANKGITVQAEAQTAYAAAREKVIATAAAGGGGPDVCYSTTAFGLEVYQAGIIRPVQAYFDKWSGKGEVIPNVVENLRGTKDDKPLLQAPWGLEVAMHYYRSDFYKEAGLQPPDSFDDLAKNARALNKPPDRYGFGLRAADGYGFRMNVLNYMSSAGVTYSDGKGGTDVDGQIAVDTVKAIAQLYWDGVAQASALQDRFPQMVALLQAGKIAQWSAGNNHSVMILGEKGDMQPKLGVSMFPKGPGGKRYVDLNVITNMMLQTTKNPDAAWEFMVALMAPDTVDQFNRIAGFAPALKSVAERSFFKENPYQKMAVDSAPSWGSYPYWHKNWSTFMLDKAPVLWQRALQKEITIETMLKELAGLMRQV